MTTIKDLLRDFGIAVSQIETNEDDPIDWNEQFDEILEDTHEHMRDALERVIG